MAPSGFGKRVMIAAATALAVVAASVSVSGAAAPPPKAAAPRAHHDVGYDGHSLTVDGKRMYVWSGEFHYWRLPSPDAWRDVLEKMKAGGFNAASIYFDWDFHSPKPGVYDFSGIRDVDRLLDIAAQVGIYVIARPGPYINAETDGGGFPGWLSSVTSKPRTTDPAYLAAADAWLTRIDRILARHQYTDGRGSVIAYQVENEYYTGTADGHAYIRHLAAKARADGIDVPLTGNHNGVFADDLDIDGHDSYPQGFNCSNPDHWSPLPDLSSARQPGEPLFLAEFQGGAFDPWGGPGYDKCRSLTDGDFEKSAYENNIASGATMQNFYMAYGGTSWGALPTPGAVYSSYDYGAPIREDRELTDKYRVDKRLGYFVQSVGDLAKTDPASGGAPTNASILRRDRRNPDTGAQFTVVRHKDDNNLADDTTHLSLPGYPTVPQAPGTALGIDGRDSKLLVSNWAMDHQQLRYSTSELMTHGTFDGRDVALLYGRKGQDGETVLRYGGGRPEAKVLSGQGVTQTWDAGSGDLRLNYVHSGLARVRITPAGGGTPLLLLLADDATADTFWRLDTPQGPVLASGPELLRTAAYKHGVLALTGDTDRAATLHVLAGMPGVREVTWNGRRTDGALDGPPSVAVPKLQHWTKRADTPEAEPGFDDAAWRAADAGTLNADAYGFHTGPIWYRGRFAGTGAETGVRVGAGTGRAGASLVWLNGRFLGSSRDASHEYPVPKGLVKPGGENVLSVLAATMPHEESGGFGQPRGLTDVRLIGSTHRIGWRLQGDPGGEQLRDPARGPLNSGGLHGERAGWQLPGAPSGGWSAAQLPDGSAAAAGVTWYRTEFDLRLPAGVDAPMGLSFSDDKGKKYRALVYVNGWMAGEYINDLGPQKSFPVQPGMLRTDGRNTVAIAVIGEDAGGDGLGAVSLEKYGAHATPLAYRDLDAPGYDPGKYREPSSAADVRITAPDTVPRGGSATVSAEFTTRRAVSGAALRLRLPDGWTAAPDAVQRLGDLPAGAAVRRSWTVTASSGAQPWSAPLSVRGTFTAGGRAGATEAATTAEAPPPAPSAGEHGLADLEFSATNGWGPVERNTSNGEQAAGDGRPMSIAGVPYLTGLGAHAPGDVTVYLGGACTRFTAQAGIDDETGGGGSAAFSVLADGKEVARTPVVKGGAAAVPIDADVSGAHYLDLVLDDGGDGNGNDHADWALASVRCG